MVGIKIGDKIKITHLATNTSRICLLTKIKDDVIYYNANMSGKILSLSSNVGPYMTIKLVENVCDRCLREKKSLVKSSVNKDMLCNDCKQKELDKDI